MSGSPWPPPYGRPGPKPNPELPWENLQQSSPPEAYKNAFWRAPVTTLRFDTTINPIWGPVQGVTYRAYWQSTVFDFRPDLHGADSNAPVAFAIRGRSGSYGAGVYLTVQFLNIPPTLSVNTRAYIIEYGHIYDATRIVQFGARQDITQEVMDCVNAVSDGSSSVVVPIQPPEGLRFWSAAVVWDIEYGNADDIPRDVQITAFCA